MKKNKKMERWSHDQTKVLISMYVDKFDELESSRCNQIWPWIVEAVSSHGPEKTLKQGKVKIRNMKDAYKKCKDGNKKSGNKSNKCPFYDEFDKLLSDRDVVNLPEFMEVGSAKSQCNYVSVKDVEYPNVIKEVSIASSSTDSFNETQDLLGNSDSEAEVAVKGNKNSKKRKHGDSSDDDEYYEDLKHEVRAKKSKAQDPKKPIIPKTFQEQLLAMQKEQIDISKEVNVVFKSFRKKCSRSS